MYDDMIKRLMACGFRKSNALDVCRRYVSDDEALENYVINAEMLFGEEKEAGKEASE